MSDQERLHERPAMTLQSAALVYAGLLIVWLGMLKLAMSTTWFPNGALIAYHLAAPGGHPNCPTYGHPNCSTWPG